MPRAFNVRFDEAQVYVGRGRGSIWGNPFKVGVDGKRGECVTLFKDWIVRGDGRHLLKRLGELEGKTLGCWCAPPGGVDNDDAWICHAQVLLALVAWRRKKLNTKEDAK